MLLAVAALASILAVSVGVRVAFARRRRSARAPAFALPRPSRRAGVSHLVAGVSELSDLGLHLRAGPPRRSLGTLLGSGHATTR